MGGQPLFLTSAITAPRELCLLRFQPGPFHPLMEPPGQYRKKTNCSQPVKTIRKGDDADTPNMVLHTDCGRIGVACFSHQEPIPPSALGELLPLPASHRHWAVRPP
ncbi:hypothetical protein NPIL_416421 [Nephila pilipes]|uniref:Uncharacterized protein n=1 Tax=Nephila pilipes TaxID=299642 RepID=A0A8X6IVX3_NEPPI|nr:hypothetical protein NPIL_416421 [Nephila pilipes]